ncbi:YoaK family protein [Aurantimonas sp. A2-1-M11]|uniref:YoaK family protein n=1 Tax=Aurantimonas sp. A2-1-M11 TaxID=3113712 RepID=UPI002F946FC1
MDRNDRRQWTLAACLAALAGYVDAIGFLKLAGLFVSFMSGNSTRLAVAVSERSALAGLALAIIAAFVGGVMLGTVLAHRAGTARKTAVLILVTALLAGAQGLDVAFGGAWPALALAVAMGAANCVFLRNGEVSIGVTYMTGTLVKLGQHLASACLGGKRFGWVPYLALWAGLLVGAVSGALVFGAVEAFSLVPAVTAAAALTLLAHRIGPVEPLRNMVGSG